MLQVRGSYKESFTSLSSTTGQPRQVALKLHSRCTSPQAGSPSRYSTCEKTKNSTNIATQEICRQAHFRAFSTGVLRHLCIMAASMLAILAPLVAFPLVNARPGESIFGRATCSTSIQSCSTAATSANTCCVNTPGGQFLQTQFWDTDPVTGPSNSWTLAIPPFSTQIDTFVVCMHSNAFSRIHGLWPDNCDGTYDEDCDSSRDYSSITNILTQFGKTDLLSYMKTYWLSNSESSEAFWEHEWSTHGTCVSTLEPSCYSSYTTGEEAADYFQIVVDLFKTLDTYTVSLCI